MIQYTCFGFAWRCQSTAGILGLIVPRIFFRSYANIYVADLPRIRTTMLRNYAEKNPHHRKGSKHHAYGGGMGDISGRKSTPTPGSTHSYSNRFGHIASLARLQTSSQNQLAHLDVFGIHVSFSPGSFGIHHPVPGDFFPELRETPA